MSDRSSSIARNIVTTYIARFSNILGLFFLFPFVSSSVGVTAFGVYLLATSVSTLFNLDLGMAGSTTRYVADARARGDLPALKSIVASSSIFFFSIGWMAAILITSVFAAGWRFFDIPEPLRTEAIICAVVVAAQTVVGSALSVNRYVLAGSGRLDLSNVVVVVQLAVRLVATTIALALDGGIVGVVIADTSAVVLGGLSLWLIRRRLVQDSIASLREATWSSFRMMFSLSVHLLTITLSALVILQSGNLIVSVVLPIAAVALYAAGYRIYQVCRELTNSLTAALLPAATSHHVKGNGAKNRHLYLTGTRFANALVIAVTVPVAIFAHPLLEAWLGATLAAGAVVAQVLVASMLFNNNHLVAVPILTAQGDVRSYARLHVVWAISSVVLGLALTPVLGIVGMALATGLPVVVLEPIYLGIALRRLGIRTDEFLRQVILRTYGIALPLAICVFGLAAIVAPSAPLMPLCVSIVWVVLFSLAFGLLGATSGDRKNLARLFTRARKR